MKKFKANNEVHEIEEGYERLLPIGAIEISDAEAAILLTPDPMTPQEEDDAKTLEADIEVNFNSTLKAFALVVLSEINTLRANAGLPERTVQQLKSAIKAKL